MKRFIRKPDRIYQQSAVIPYSRSADDLSVVLITNRKKTGWIYPKGLVERNMSPPESACQEALEEAGVVGAVSDSLLDRYSYEKWGGTCIVEVYPLEIDELLDEWDEMDFRERRTVDIEAAIEIVRPEQRPAILQLRAFLNGTSDA